MSWWALRVENSKTFDNALETLDLDNDRSSPTKARTARRHALPTATPAAFLTAGGLQSGSHA